MLFELKDNKQPLSINIDNKLKNLDEEEEEKKDKIVKKTVKFQHDSDGKIIEANITEKIMEVITEDETENL